MLHDKNAFDTLGTSTARYGCCPANKYMSSPFITFVEANSCSSCPAGTHVSLATSVLNDETSCMLLGVYDKMPDGCKGKVWTDRDCDLRKAVDELSADTYDSIYQPRYRLTYGPMKDWDISLVTDLKFAFYEKGSFNGDISKWQTQKVTTLWYSK